MEWQFSSVRRLFYRGRKLQENPLTAAEKNDSCQVSGSKFSKIQSQKTCNSTIPAVPDPHHDSLLDAHTHADTLPPESRDGYHYTVSTHPVTVHPFFGYFDFLGLFEARSTFLGGFGTFSNLFCHCNPYPFDREREPSTPYLRRWGSINTSK